MYVCMYVYLCACLENKYVFYLVFWSLDLHQCVDFPTHIHGHSLDLMIRSSGYNVLSVSASYLISDHFSVVANL